MRKQGFFKKFFSSFEATPFHPQWFIFRKNNKHLYEISAFLNGTILDIGCSKKLIKNYLSDDCKYIGLDYYKTATEWYGTIPEVYGDAHSLSFRDESIDCVLLLDVMEHLADPEKCLNEVNRILDKNGCFIISVPFLYPIHDSPLDFRRWTIYGLKELADKHGFNIKEEKHNGNIFESASLIMNIAISKTILNWIDKKNPAAVFIITLPFIVFTINIIGWFITSISPMDNMMPMGYRIVLEKNNS